MRDDSYYRFDSEKGTGAQVAASSLINALSQNGRYRAFVGSTQNLLCKNPLYIRSLSAEIVTKSVYPLSVEKQSAKKKVSLIFDPSDNSEGLPQILSALKKYNVKGTFFINGEFIRLYPLETKQIVQNCQKCASMFFTTSDLTSPGFVITEDFIDLGLALKEDEFYQSIGTELNLYWNAPNYKVTDAIKEYENSSVIPM